MTESDSSTPSSEPAPMPRNVEMIWWGVLIVSVLTGLGMSFLAPT